MAFFFIPEQITVTIDVSEGLRTLVEKIIDAYQAPQKAEELAKRLNDGADELDAVAAVNPDPDPND